MRRPNLLTSVATLLLGPSTLNGCGFVRRQLLLTLWLAFAIVAPTEAAATLVQSNSGIGTTATTAATWSSAATTGTTLVMIVASDDYIGATPSGWTESTGCRQEVFHGAYLFWKIAAGGETSQNYTIGSATGSVWITAEISGLDASPYDISAGQSNGGGAPVATYTTPAITPSTGDRYLIAVIVGSYTSSATLSTWLNSFTEQRDVTSTAPSTKDQAGYADLAVTGNGVTTYSSGATYSAARDSQSGIIISFKVAAGGGPAPTKRLLLMGVGL